MLLFELIPIALLIPFFNKLSIWSLIKEMIGDITIVTPGLRKDAS